MHGPQVKYFAAWASYSVNKFMALSVFNKVTDNE